MNNDKCSVDKVFVEKDFYVEPPDVSDIEDESDLTHIWNEWYRKDAIERDKHEKQWKRSKKSRFLPNFDKAFTMIKVDGVWHQRSSMSVYINDLNGEKFTELYSELEESENE